MTKDNKQQKLSYSTEPAIAYSTCYRLPFLSIFHADCMEIMKDIETGTIDLIVTDPPYGIEDMKPYFTEMLRCLSKDGSIYVFGNKNMIAEYWFSQLKIDNKELLVWHYKNSPKPKGRW